MSRRSPTLASSSPQPRAPLLEDEARHIVLARPRTPDALAPLADALVRDGVALPGVTAALPEVDADPRKARPLGEQAVAWADAEGAARRLGRPAQGVEPVDERGEDAERLLDRVGRCQVDAGPPEEVERIGGAARAKKVQVALRGAGLAVEHAPCERVCARDPRRVLVDVERRVQGQELR